MAQHDKPNPPFSLRLSEAERKWLEAAADGEPIGTFIKERLFADEQTLKRKRLRISVHDHVALAKVLAALGASRLASNLNQIAKAANMGALPVSPELESDLTSACGEIREMRDRLMQALGVRKGGAP